MQHGTEGTWPTHATLYRNPPVLAEQSSHRTCTQLITHCLGFPSSVTGIMLLWQGNFFKNLIYRIRIYIYTFLLKMEVLLQKLSLGSGK